MTKCLNILVAAGIIVAGYLLRDAMKQRFQLPQETSSDDLVLNITLISTNDLHSSFSGLGLRSYPELISGGYSKLVTLINSVR
jgi:2',3'-cyclic-nucleotide 2'-phosphodiesterase (5'-nucleotidase family)